MAVIYKATNLDPQNIAIDADIIYRFSWQTNGSAQTDYQVLIYNNDTNALLHDSTKVTSTDEFYDLTATTLANALDCKWYVKTYSGVDYADSDYEFFTTRHTPTATFTDPTFASPPETLTTQDYTFKVDYNQTENVAIKRFKFVLYESSGTTEVDSSGWIYEFTPQWTFTGMVNNTTYQIECIVESQDSLTGTTGKKSLVITYSVPSNVPAISVIPNNVNGSMNISWTNLKAVTGVVSGGTSAYVTGKFNYGIDLNQNSTELLYSEAFFDTIYTFTYWFKLQWGHNGDFMEFNAGNKKVGYEASTNRFYYDDNSVITYSSPVALYTWADFTGIPWSTLSGYTWLALWTSGILTGYTANWFFIGITANDIIIKMNNNVIAYIDIV